MAAAPAVAEGPPDGPDADPRIVEMMDAVPGGVLVDANHAVWPALDMEMTVPGAHAGTTFTSVGACPGGRICVFSGRSLTGPSLSWGSCGDHSIPSNFTALSLANARSSGYAQARNGGSVFATAYAGRWANILGAATYVRCVL
ncbi:hypothetical protein [Microbacterium aurantiacum]|uniref:hypothetical protein n=1 Tax=Microbacterium aurantiacum TaxID=162393 RepID=UPI0011AF1DD2|nr:hypothetical protein [Microbacterium aurantiacum]